MQGLHEKTRYSTGRAGSCRRIPRRRRTVVLALALPLVPLQALQILLRALDRGGVFPRVGLFPDLGLVEGHQGDRRDVSSTAAPRPGPLGPISPVEVGQPPGDDRLGGRDVPGAEHRRHDDAGDAGGLLGRPPAVGLLATLQEVDRLAGQPFAIGDGPPRPSGPETTKAPKAQRSDRGTGARDDEDGIAIDPFWELRFGSVGGPRGFSATLVTYPGLYRPRGPSCNG